MDGLGSQILLATYVSKLTCTVPSNRSMQRVSLHDTHVFTMSSASSSKYVRLFKGQLNYAYIPSLLPHIYSNHAGALPFS